jgi:hypothetical protein
MQPMQAEKFIDGGQPLQVADRGRAEGVKGNPSRALWAPPDLGLAVYFWSRMGLRPLNGPGPDGGIWFERVLRG